ncbi:MAG TPA: hypothetical protein VFS97_00065 [Nitrososphaeraceae archaeon]|nr:hypothetical protein [Nitrososphaeraceae archaeon]
MTGAEAKVENIGSADSPKVHFTYEKKKVNLAYVRPWGASSNTATDINYGYRYREEEPSLMWDLYRYAISNM